MKNRAGLLAAAMIVASALSPARAFVSFGNGFGSKWDDPHFGTPAMVTWAFVADGTGVDPSFDIDFGNEPGSGVTGTSNISQLRATVDATYGAGAFDAAVRSALQTWSDAANITFVEVTDSGLPMASSGATSPDIRISAFTPQPGHSFNNVGAVGFGPPGDDLNFPDALAGDILFNLAATFIIAPGGEDNPITLFGNDVDGLTLHELGHAAIGLGHPAEAPGVVMFVGPDCCDVINRELSADDMAGAVFTYGPRCAADLDGNGDVDVFDLLAYLDLWFGEDAAADLDASGEVDVFDLLMYLDGWFAGC